MRVRAQRHGKDREMQIGESERADTSGGNAEREGELDEGRKRARWAAGKR